MLRGRSSDALASALLRLPRLLQRRQGRALPVGCVPGAVGPGTDEPGGADLESSLYAAPIVTVVVIVCGGGGGGAVRRSRRPPSGERS